MEQFVVKDASRLLIFGGLLYPFSTLM